MTHEDLHAKLVALLAERAAGAPVTLVGIAGAVAVGKSTLARSIAEALAAPAQIVPTDGFLKPNSVLAEAGLIQRKGFPETYDLDGFHGFLADLAAGRGTVIPVYSHVAYDIVPDQTRRVEGSGVVIVEGVNVLQTAEARGRFGLSIYVEADPDHIKAWYLKRLDEIIANEPGSLIAQIPDPELRRTLIERAWTEINLVNLRDHIAPTAAFADVIVRKGADHELMELVVR